MSWQLQRVRTALVNAGAVAVLFTSSAVAGGSVSVPNATLSFDMPSDDRWHYPFNFTPGTRGTASTFGAPLPGFSDRDGALLVAWDTSQQLPVGLGIDAYGLRSISIVLTGQANQFFSPVWEIDLTVDEWFTVDLDLDGVINADGIPRGAPGDLDGESDDVDAGRPIELFGTAFGDEFTAQTWDEFSPYVGTANGPSIARDPFPFVYQAETLEVLHVEDHIKGLYNDQLAQPVFSFTPEPWAIGVPQNYTPGNQPTPFEVRFDVNLELSDGAVRAYYRDQLNTGRLFAYVTSLADTIIQGPANAVPSFYTKEGVFDPGAQAPALFIEVCTPPQFDANRSCCIDGGDAEPFFACVSGAMNLAAVDCDVNDDDADLDVDLGDFAVVQRAVGSCAT